MYRFALILAVLMAAGAPGGLLTPSPALAQEQIARVKSAPYDYRDRVIRLAGEAVEVRGVTPVSTQGIYRLVDASDPSGVLIRTASLPEISGPFTVRARLSEQFLFEGALLLEEIDRDDPFPALPYLPLVVLVGGLLFSGFFLHRFFKARKTERHLHLAPPMWLIPTDQEPGLRSEHGEPGEPVKGTSDAGTPVKFNYRMQFVEEERSAQLDRIKRRSLRALIGTIALSLAGAGWLVAVRADTAGRPTFVLLTPETVAVANTQPDLPADDTLAVPLVSPEGPPVPAARTPAVPRGQPAARQPTDRPQTQVTPPPAPPRPVPDTPPRTPARTPARLPERVGPGAQDSASQQGRVVTLAPDTGRVVRVTRPVQEPAATPPPPPPPPPSAQPPPSPPARDPEAERRAAADAIQDGVNQLVAAINGRQHDRVAALLPVGGNAQWRTRFLEHLLANETRVESITVQPAELDAGAAGASASLTLTLRWRANFGVQRTRDAGLVAGARQTGGAWRFTGARLLASFP